MREVVIDTETTGLNHKLGDRIIEVGCVEIQNYIPTGKTLQFYCRPDKSISEDYAGLQDAHKMVRSLIEKYSDNHEIIIGGFSQGAALSLSYQFEKSSKIKACIALSGYMPNIDNYKNKSVVGAKIFIAHGKSDNVITFESYKKTINFLESKCDDIHKYVGDFGHTITKEVTTEMTDWISKII